MAEDRTPDDVRRLTTEIYTAAATRTPKAGDVAAAPLDLAALDLTDETGPALVIEDVVPGALADAAGYAELDLSGIPPGALQGSFASERPVSRAEIQPGQTVLDMGCGQGLDLILAARAVGPTGRAIGVDITPAQVERAQRHIAEAGVANAEVRHGPMETLPVEDASVDWVISNGAINYSPEKPKVFAEIFRVLKPGGRALVCDVLVENLDPAMAYRLFGYLRDAGATGQAGYVQFMRDAGFVDIEVLSRTEYTARQMLALVGYDADPEGVDVDALQGIFSLLEGTMITAAIHARKPD